MKDTVTGCSVELAMHLLGGRWRLLIASYLIDGPKRFNELRRLIPGISQRMLSLDLRALEDASLIARTVYPTVPVKVEYALTEEGRRLGKVVAVVQEFGLWLKDRNSNWPYVRFGPKAVMLYGPLCAASGLFTVGCRMIAHDPLKVAALGRVQNSHARSY
ncbi:DNA-binding HxlR family transcriptional regulator [Agrobacterium larrymoorei]|uniref:DNA-binding HxlR family transcriptional regulator n=2 Tax=Agrobacterium TaxID=357 RepID=A0AAJ2BAG9_9HYPH|nr:DNA-binding HxlR family transcriptional regulator [Agrobacterium larrymoorei]